MERRGAALTQGHRVREKVPEKEVLEEVVGVCRSQQRVIQSVGGPVRADDVMGHDGEVTGARGEGCLDAAITTPDGGEPGAASRRPRVSAVETGGGKGGVSSSGSTNTNNERRGKLRRGGLTRPAEPLHPAPRSRRGCCCCVVLRELAVP